MEMAAMVQDQFNGRFVDVNAHDLRVNDVILGGARSVIAAAVANGSVTVETVTGTEIFDADAMVYVFRPPVNAQTKSARDAMRSPANHAT
jgi:hypothetical protein